MSALGQKQTSTHVQPMSALPPKADIARRFVPEADSCTAAISSRSKTDLRSLIRTFGSYFINAGFTAPL
jgi:hypothetical protein